MLYLRHGRTDNSHPDRVPRVDFNDCTTQRPLTAQGRADSARIGAALRQARIEAGTRFHRDLTEIQHLVGTTLEQAGAGQLDAGRIYRLHTEVVERLAALEPRLATLRHTEPERGDPTADAAEDFDAYRQLITQAGDLADGELETPAMSEVQTISHNAGSVLRDIAQSVLAFRQTILAREAARYDLGERMKEMACLYDVFRITERPDLELAAMLEAVARRLPTATRYPAVAIAHIDYAGTRYGSSAHQFGTCHRACPIGETLTVTFDTTPDQRGQVAVTYLSPLPADAIELVDPQTLRYVRVNLASARMLGYTREEQLVAERSAELMTAKDLAEAANRSKSAFLANIELVVNLRGLPPLLHGDGLRLGQILLNFASNAVKFTQQSRITFGADRVGETLDGLLVRFAVSDSGIGPNAFDEDRERCLRAALPESETAATPPTRTAGLDWVHVRRVTMRLETLLANDDLDSTAVLDEHRALLAAALGAPATTLAQAIETFDYDRALLTLRTAVAATPAAAVQA